jgi:hypothetical protein
MVDEIKKIYKLESGEEKWLKHVKI